jgi:ribosomal protein S27E
MRRRATGLKIECPQCNAHSVFHRAAFPRLDSSGFETYSFRCQNCGASIVGVIDPFDGKLLLSTDAESNVKAVPDHEKVH